MSVLIGAIAGGVAATIAVTIVAKRAQKVAPDIVKTLSERGPSTVAEIMAANGLKGISKMGYVQNALVALVREGRVVTIDPPLDTPRMKRMKLTKYRVITT